MNWENLYIDNQGNEFDFLAVSNPLNDGRCEFTSVTSIGFAMRADTNESVELYDYFGLQRAGGAGILFTKTEEPFVLFQSVNDDDAEDLKVLPIHDFFKEYKPKK